MEKIKSEVWEKLLGYNPGREVKEAILAEVAETGKLLQQVLAEGRIVPYMPELAILGSDGKFDYKGQRITASEWEKINPLGRFGKLVIVGRREQVEKHRFLCNDTK